MWYSIIQTKTVSITTKSEYIDLLWSLLGFVRDRLLIKEMKIKDVNIIYTCLEVYFKVLKDNYDSL